MRGKSVPRYPSSAEDRFEGSPSSDRRPITNEDCEGRASHLAARAITAASPALAEKGGAGRGNRNGGGDSGGTPWVSASPNPASAEGSRVELNGCGYDVNYPAEVRIVHSAGYAEADGVAVWNTGCLNRTPFLTREAGTYTISVYQRPPKPRRASPQLKASTVPTVR
jgi:hypothetical protein